MKILSFYARFLNAFMSKLSNRYVNVGTPPQTFIQWLSICTLIVSASPAAGSYCHTAHTHLHNRIYSLTYPYIFILLSMLHGLYLITIIYTVQLSCAIQVSGSIIDILFYFMLFLFKFL